MRKSKGATTWQNSSNNRNQTNTGAGLLLSAAGPSKNNQVPCQCYWCWGWGHMAKECVMSLNYLKGGSNVPSPQIKESKTGRELNRPSPNKCHHPQISRKTLSQSRPSGLPHWKGEWNKNFGRWHGMFGPSRFRSSYPPSILSLLRN